MIGRHRSVSFSGLLAVVAGMLLAACAQASLATPEPVTLTIAGSTEMQPVLADLTAEFSRRHPNVLFSLREGGSRLGEEWVANGHVDLAASTAVYPDRDLDPALVRVPLGLDGVAVVVHPDNPVDALTLLQLRNLFSGRVLDWRDVGGDDGEVLLVSREDGSATRALFEERVMGEEGVALTAVVMPSSRDVVEFVATHPWAVGYVSRAYAPHGDAGSEGGEVAGRSAGGPAVKVLKLEGMVPNRETISQQRYHLSRPLYLVRRAEKAEWVQKFIDFALSPDGQRIVARYHVPVR